MYSNFPNIKNINIITMRDLMRESPLDRSDMWILAEYAFSLMRTQLIAHDDDPLDMILVDNFLLLQNRRQSGEPIAQIVGVREFFGRSFHITKDVLIPRPETELLVEATLIAIDRINYPYVLDLGTGSGAIAISIAAERQDARVFGLDCSVDALAIARYNEDELLGNISSRRPGGRIRWLESDWYSSLNSGLLFDAIVSNPPYIAHDDPHLSQGDLRFEPKIALTDYNDGLSAIRLIIEDAHLFLKRGGSLLIEHGCDQAKTVRTLLATYGFTMIESLIDLASIERTTSARLN
ncbi:MAG: peptide chain release factor N(5)-glutamine methyltransferase [Burkholderia sp.]|nr:peptide chain release factor N(5)-glutamine methyltransferase [Burkholderia sp.]